MERGPQERVHAPEYQEGCYRMRAGDCCWLCLFRLGYVAATAPFKRYLAGEKGGTKSRDVENNP